MQTSTAADTSSADHRAAIRFDTAMPLRIDGAHGRTYNISSNGVYFETDVPQEVGALVNFTVEFHLHGQTHQMRCEAKVVRVDEHGTRLGVAARLLAPFFAPAEEGEAITLPA